jgi:adenine-specific DNA-methyltransferase
MVPRVNDLGEAIARGERLRLSIGAEHRKRWGQYITPAKLVAFMAEAAAAGPVSRCVRILDPGAGTGSLGLGLAEELLDRRRVGRVEIVSVEHEHDSLCELQGALNGAMTKYGDQRLSALGLGGDFLTAMDGRWFHGHESFDIAISNPPYFKLSPKDKRSGDAPNIYARFMAVAAGLLREGGRLCFVVPRSYLSGSYFRRFRESFHEMMQLDSVHTFDSRRMAFGRDDVLQESIVVVYEKRRATAEDAVVFSSSAGLDDLPSGYPESRLGQCDAAFVVERKDLDINGALALPSSPEQFEAGRKLCRFDSTIASLGLKVSTGPVVPFRCTELADADEASPTVPLLWMQHVKRGAVTWPLAGFHKPERVRTPSRNLTPLRNYVLVRRVSAKEDAHRITAAPLIAKDWDAKSIGLENHLNYIHRTGDPLAPQGIGVGEARGLAAILNSQLYDQYIRMVSGTTQVSATELRALPMPRLPYIEQAGRRSEEQVEALLAQLLGRP